jgi:hypothetical protein
VGVINYLHHRSINMELTVSCDDGHMIISEAHADDEQPALRIASQLQDTYQQIPLRFEIDKLTVIRDRINEFISKYSK